MAAKKKLTKKAPAKKPVTKKKPSAAKKSPAKKPAGKKSFDSKRTLAKKPAAAAKRSTGRGAAKGKAAPRKTKRPAARPARPARKVAPKSKAPLRENAEGLALAHTIATAALEKKALDVIIIDTRARGSSVGYDYVVLATGESDRQLEAIASAVEDAAAATNRKPTVEASPEWVLSNFDDVVAHFFTADKRAAYDLEGLWSDAPRIDVA